MTKQTTVFNRDIAGDRFEIVRVEYDTVRERGGFSRYARATRHVYKFNGVVIAKCNWLTLRDVSEAEG